MALDFGGNIDQAIADSHLPALMCALVHLTGNADHLTAEWRPSYTPMQRADIGVPEAEQEKMRAFAKGLIENYLAGRVKPVAELPVPVIRRMMDYVTGVDIPENYLGYLMDELALAGVSSKDPRWDTPRLRLPSGKLAGLMAPSP